MKRRWETPKAMVEEFEANEYVAVCWGVSCLVDKANAVEKQWMLNRWESNYENGQTHSGDHCGMLTNQWVIDDNNDGTVDRMIETGTDGLGDLTCTLFADDSYKTQVGFAGVKTGSYIYWTTSSGDRVWHHQGTVIGTDSSHPNRS
ncbi:MAG: hypothetical protein KHX75_09155 [Lachnospiraceae bacterium]|nr:hypothetical protein [Lachnospiraceae bacterium]